MQTAEKILHAEVVGSMHRPAELLRAREQFREGKLAPRALEQIENTAVDAALTLQRDAGLEVVTDGEMRRDFFFDFFVRGVSGLSPAPAATLTFHNSESDAEQMQIPFSVTEKIRAAECPGVAEFRYASQRTDKLIKVTLPSPMMMLGFYGDASREVYPDPFELAVDATEAVQQWMRQLAEAGCRYIQIDAPEMCEVYVDQRERDRNAAQGISPDRFISVGTELLAQLGALELPGVRKAVHVCKGNGTQSWLAEGGYGDFTMHVFRRLDGFEVFHMEYDDERSGGFEPLSHLPDDKVAVLGLVSTKWAKLEDPDALVARIEDAARFHPIERLAIAPQCGFAAAAMTAEDRKVLPNTQQDKLRLVTSVARRVWG